MNTDYLIEMNNNNITEPNMVVSLDEYVDIIEYFKENIKNNELIKINLPILIEQIIYLMDNKEKSSDYNQLYDNFIDYLEKSDTEHQFKYENLIEHILENMDSKKINNLPRNYDGNPTLISRPVLERSHNISTYVKNRVSNEPIYTLLLSIKYSINGILQFERDYLHTK